MTETKTQTEIQTETKQNVPRSKKKLATILFLVLLFLILLVSVTTPSSQPSKNDTQQTTTANENAPVSDTTESLLSQTSTIMYRPSPNELFDALPDGTGAIDLSSIVGLSNESPLEAIKMLPDKKHFYFVHEHYLWLTDIQGKQVKEFPNLQDNIVDISLLLMDSKGNLLFVITDRQQHNSFYYYELSTNTLTPLENNANQYDHNKAFLQLSDTSFSYFNYDDRYLYKSDINAGKPTRLSSVPLPTSPTTIQNPVIDNLFLDNTTSVIYTIQPSDTSIYQSSGIFLFNYQTNQRTQISPENDAQGRYLPLTFSPDKTKLLYTKVVTNKDKLTYEYYLYNLKQQQTQKLALTEIGNKIGDGVIWNQHTLIYNDDNNRIFRYDLDQNTRTTLPLQGVIENAF